LNAITQHPLVQKPITHPDNFWSFTAGALIFLFILYLTKVGSLDKWIKILLYNAAPAEKVAAPSSAPGGSGSGQSPGLIQPTPPAGATGPGVPADRRRTGQWVWDWILKATPIPEAVKPFVGGSGQ
jgi:hypothetical protein